MILQPATVYENHRIYLLKDGIDQTGEIWKSGTWTYAEDTSGKYIWSDTSSAAVCFPKQYFIARYIYFELRAMISASNYSIYLRNGSSNWDYQSWYNSNGVQYGANSASNYTFWYGKRGTGRCGTNMLTVSLSDSALIGVGKTFNTVRIYNIYLSNYTNDFISKTPYLNT